jgi:hypothetical protein
MVSVFPSPALSQPIILFDSLMGNYISYILLNIYYAEFSYQKFIYPEMAVFWVVAPCCLVDQKTAIFVLTAVRTSNPTQYML